MTWARPGLGAAVKAAVLALVAFVLSGPLSFAGSDAAALEQYSHTENGSDFYPTLALYGGATRSSRAVDLPYASRSDGGSDSSVRHSAVTREFRVAAKAGDETVSGGQYLFNTWHKGTFENRTRSVNYHLARHGKGRSAVEYTRDAMDFFAANRSLRVPVILKDGSAGIKIATKQPGGGVQKVAGYWTSDGRLVTFWD